MPGIFRRLGRLEVEFITPPVEPAVRSSQAIIRDALREIDRLMSTVDPSLRDPLLDVRNVLQPPPAVPVVPGRSS